MTGLARLNSAVNFSALSVGPDIVIDSMDEVVMRMPGLVHYLDPARAVGVKKFKSRGDGGTVQWTTDNLVAVASDAALNNRPAFHFLADDTDMVLPLGTPTPSFTIVAVASMTAARYAGSAATVLWSSYTPEDSFVYEVIFQHLHASNFYVGTPEANTGGNGSNIPEAGMPVGDQLAVWGHSFDFGTLTSEYYVNNALTPVATKTNAAGPHHNDPGARWSFGSLEFSHSLGWVGKAGRLFIFNQAFHTMDPLRDKLQGLVSALKTYYAIA